MHHAAADDHHLTRRHARDAAEEDARTPEDLLEILGTFLDCHPARDLRHRGQERKLAGVAKDLGVFVGGQQIRDYAEWAFSRDPRSSTSIGQLVDEIEQDYKTERAPSPRAPGERPPPQRPISPGRGPVAPLGSITIRRFGSSPVE